MIDDRAAQLRRQFDDAFQLEAQFARPDTHDLLAIRLGGKRYGLRLHGVEGVVKGKSVTPLPGAPPDLLGVAGFRGTLVAVFDLADWLGLKRETADWLALLRVGDCRIGLAFDHLEGQLRLETGEFLEGDPSALVESRVNCQVGVLPVLSISKLTERLANGGGHD